MSWLVRPATSDDAEYIAAHLRAEDLREIAKMHDEPHEAVMRSFRWSDEVSVFVVDGRPALLFGVMDSMTGVPKCWALGTDDCRKYSRIMVKLGRHISDALADKYWEMENWCDADYTASLRWLRLLGFTVEDPQDGFCHLYKRGGAVCAL